MSSLVLMEYAKVATQGVNKIFINREPWQIVTITATTVLSTVWIWNLINKDESIWLRGKKQFFRLIRKLPMIRRKVEKELAKSLKEFENEITKNCAGITYAYEMPEKGLPKEKIIKLVEEHLKRGEYNWKDGRVSGTVYSFNPELVDLITEVYGKASYTNPLHVDVFPGICKMEAEVVRMSCMLFHGDSNSCGTMTTGGTESIMMACKAYRDFARENKGITTPNMVVPASAHAAFDKAAQYLGIHVKYTRLNSNTFEADVGCMKRAINSNTILLVGSAPNFPYGTIDEIEDIAALGVKYNIPVHVDACLGSFLVAFMPKAGYSVKPFDFAVNGVTSISADTHKYGFAPKGSSVIMYSDKKYLNYQFTVTTDWPGGVYGSPTINGSRAGGIIAACWATMTSIGKEGYLEITKRIVDTARYIEAGIRKIDGIFIYGKPATSVIAIGSNIFDIFRLSDSLCKRGWNLNPLQFPSGIHICITDIHTKAGVAEQFLSDLKEAVDEIRKNPSKPVEGKMAIYGVAQCMSDRSIVGDVTRAFISSMYYIPNIGK